MKRVSLMALSFLIVGLQSLQADDQKAVAKEYEQEFTTYPYSDPNPIPTITSFPLPTMSSVYPYFRYDGFTQTPVPKKWKVVELSNAYLKLQILPEISGKVWTAIDKTTGKSFLYDNHVIKFRDISLRGPWTSGGLEANYGVFGHTPNCFSPVDYLVRTNADGSVSCFIGTLDLLTRSSWQIEIKLAPGQAFFTTRSTWHNGSGLEEPYYTWMNAAVKGTDDLQLIFPGTHYIYHDGKAYDWPIDKDGHKLSWYAKNNFGRNKSYHVLGDFSDFYGAYWHDEDFGMAHYAPFEDKIGEKIWIWSLSRSGMIWQDLLMDGQDPYVEIQSGRLFNQAAPLSSLTPFKNKDFSPYATDIWEEHWMPVKGIKGFVSASPLGAMNVAQKHGRLIIGLSPVQTFQGKLEVFDGTNLLNVQTVDLKPMQPVQMDLPLAHAPEKLRVCLGGDKLVYAADDENVLSRPFESPTNFDWNSAYGLYVNGKELERRRDYVDAADSFQCCLATNPDFLPALAEMASLANRCADYSNAYNFAWRGLSLDTYDPAANYQFGLASAGLGRQADAKAAFSIAAISMGWRSAADTELAKEYLREKEFDRALTAARNSLDYDRNNLDGLEVEACIARLNGDSSQADSLLNDLSALTPLNHFAEFEKYLNGKAGAREFTNSIRWELPVQTYLESAIWYHNVGLDQDALKVLELAPAQAEVLYWQAYLKRDTGLLAHANAASPAFVFPFRPESMAVFEWAMKHSDAWQPKYYLALIRWFQGKLDLAGNLLAGCENRPDFAPFYATRAQVIMKDAAADLRRAIQMDPDQWRFAARLVRYDLQHTNAAEAVQIAAGYDRRFPGNSTLTWLHAESLIATGQYQAAVDLLTSTVQLPAEGATRGHALYYEANLRLAIGRMKAGQFHQALAFIAQARQWPENLGTGEPYPVTIDDRLEDWLTFQCDRGLGLQKEARQTLKILAWQLWPKTGDLNDAKPRTLPETDAGGIIHALALKESGHAEAAQKLLAPWGNDGPDSDLAKWGEAVLAGRFPALPPECQDEDARILSSWLENSK
jgi:tetratricopeptide (TPR) repeat protein